MYASISESLCILVAFISRFMMRIKCWWRKVIFVTVYDESKVLVEEGDICYGL